MRPFLSQHKQLCSHHQYHQLLRAQKFCYRKIDSDLNPYIHITVFTLSTQIGEDPNFDFNDPNKAFSIVLSPFKDLEQNLSEIPEKRKEQLDLALCNVEKSYTNLAKQILETKGKSNN